MSCIQVAQQPWVVTWAAEGGGPSEQGDWRWVSVILIVCGGGDVDTVEGLLSTSPGMDPHGSHTLSLLQIQKVWGRS